MPYPDSQLAGDERVVEHLHPHWITIVPPVLILLVAAGLGGFLAAIAPDGSAQGPLRIAIVVVGVLVLVWFTIIPVLRWRTTHYVITTHRVMIRSGILSHNGHDIPLQRLNDVAFSQSLADRIIGAGSLTLESAGERGQETLTNVPHSDKVQQLINRLSEEDSDRRTGYRAPAPDPPPGDAR
ncbi:MAG: PH domain-containing protein [Mycobacteriales bacterium]|nr:MAG: hypothetical protein DLM56_02930 [Pseudonocardiales bacterium]